VVLLNLQVLSRISLAQRDELGIAEETEEAQFELVLNAILNLFAKDRQLLETRGSLIIRKLCVLLNAKSVYIRLANALIQYETADGQSANAATLEFVSTMVQTLNLILLTASELHDLRSILAKRLMKPGNKSMASASVDSPKVFSTLFRCWCHNPVATFSLCLLAQAYDLSFALVKRFSQMEDVTVGFLMQIDKLVYLLESPIFVHLRLQLLDVESKHHAALLKSIYGILLCLPQGDAFRLLNNRLTTVCNLRDNLGLNPIHALPDDDTNYSGSTSRPPLSMEKLLMRFDDVLEMHRAAKELSHRLAIEEEQRDSDPNSVKLYHTTGPGSDIPHVHSSVNGSSRTAVHGSLGPSHATETSQSPRKNAHPNDIRMAESR
jgi:vacuole morphology and inheritance protein 14